MTEFFALTLCALCHAQRSGCCCSNDIFQNLILNAEPITLCTLRHFSPCCRKPVAGEVAGFRPPAAITLPTISGVWTALLPQRRRSPAGDRRSSAAPTDR